MMIWNTTFQVFQFGKAHKKQGAKVCNFLLSIGSSEVPFNPQYLEPILAWWNMIQKMHREGVLDSVWLKGNCPWYCSTDLLHWEEEWMGFTMFKQQVSVVRFVLHLSAMKLVPWSDSHLVHLSWRHCRNQPPPKGRFLLGSGDTRKPHFSHGKGEHILEFFGINFQIFWDFPETMGFHVFKTWKTPLVIPVIPVSAAGLAWSFGKAVLTQNQRVFEYFKFTVTRNSLEY